MERIVIDAYRCAPRVSVVTGRGDKYVHISVGVVAPRHVEPSAVRVHSDLRKTVGARHAGDCKIHRPCWNNAMVFAEGTAAIVGDGHHDAVPSFPHALNRSIPHTPPVKPF